MLSGYAWQLLCLWVMYSGTAIALIVPMIETVISDSAIVKPSARDERLDAFPLDCLAFIFSVRKLLVPRLFVFCALNASSIVNIARLAIARRA